MPELRIIPTITEATINGSLIAITTSYRKNTLPDTIKANISDMVGVENQVSFVEGHCIVEMKNSPEHLDYYIARVGNLRLLINTGDENNYSIDQTGHLIYTYNQ